MQFLTQIQLVLFQGPTFKGGFLHAESGRCIVHIYMFAELAEFYLHTKLPYNIIQN